VYVDGGYVGPVAKAKNFPLRPGNHELELRDPSGNTFYRESVQVIPGRTTEIHANYAEGGPNEVFGILGSMGYLEISANRAAAAQIIGAGKGSEVTIVLEGAVAASNGQ
jgi:hypothetical protein